MIVGRHINGITINPLEYLLDDEGNIRHFKDYDEAEHFLCNQNGLSLKDLSHLVFIDDEGWHLGRSIKSETITSGNSNNT